LRKRKWNHECIVPSPKKKKTGNNWRCTECLSPRKNSQQKKHAVISNKNTCHLAKNSQKKCVGMKRVTRSHLEDSRYAHVMPHTCGWALAFCLIWFFFDILIWLHMCTYVIVHSCICIRVCILIYTIRFLCTWIFVYRYLYLYGCTHVYIYLYLYLYVNTHIYVYIYSYIFIQIHENMCLIYTCKYVYLCIYVYIYVYMA